MRSAYSTQKIHYITTSMLIADALEKLKSKMCDVLPNITVAEIRTKLNYLRSQYGRELLKISESKKSGAGTDDIYVPSAYWFDYLHFLRNSFRVRSGKSNISQIFDENSLPEMEEKPSSSKRCQVDTNDSLSVIEDVGPPKIKKKKPYSESDEVLQAATDYLKKINEDEKDTFATGLVHFISTSIAEISDKDLRDELSSKIMLLVFEYLKKQRVLNNNII